MMRSCTSLCVLSLCFTAVVLTLPWKPSLGMESAGNFNLIIEAIHQIAAVGSSIRLKCSLSLATSSSSSQTQQYNASDIQWNHNASVRMGGMVQILDEATSQLVLESAQIEDGGVYNCCLTVACNDIHSSSIEITIGYPPEPAKALQCSCNNFRNVNCTWERGRQHNNLPSIDVLQRSRVQNKWETLPAATCTQTTCHLFCPESIAEYSYRVNSSTRLGIYVYSQTSTFNSDTETIPDPPSNVTVSYLSSSSLIVRWDLPSSLSGLTWMQSAAGLDHLCYCVKYWWEAEDSKAAIKIKGLDGKKLKYTVRNLTHPYGLCHVRVGSYSKFSSIGKKCAYSERASGRTKEIEPKDVPGNFTCRSDEPVIFDRNGTRIVTLTWKPLTSEYMQNGVILDYLITVQNQNSKTQSTTAGPNETSYILKDLAQNERYDITIQAENSIGLSNASTCHVNSIAPSAGSLLLVYVGLISFLFLSLLICVVVLGRKAYMKTVRRWSHFRVPSQLMNNSFPHISPRAVVQESEEFDELHPCCLTAALVSGQTQVESPGAARWSGEIANSFDIGDETLQLGARVGFPDTKQPMAGCDINMSPDSHHLPGRHRNPSSGTFSVSSSLHSPISVGSGGSYLILKDIDKISYSRMTRDGLSPVDNNDANGQRVSGDASLVNSPAEGNSDFTGLTSHFNWGEGNDEWELLLDGVNSTTNCLLSESFQLLPGESASPGISIHPKSPCWILSSPTEFQEKDNDCTNTLLGAGLFPFAEEKDGVDSTLCTNQEAENDGREEEDSDDCMAGVNGSTVSAILLPDSSPSASSFPTMSGSAASKLGEEPSVVSPLGSIVSPVGYLKTNPVDSSGMTESTEGQNAVNPLLPIITKNMLNINLVSESKRSNKDWNCIGVEGNNWDVQSDCHRNTGYMSEEEALLSPNSNATSPVRFTASNSMDRGLFPDGNRDATSLNNVSQLNDLSVHAADESIKGSLDSVTVGSDIVNEDEKAEVLKSRNDVSLPETCTNQVCTNYETDGANRVPLVCVAVGTDDGDEELEKEQETKSDMSVPGSSSDGTQPPTKSDISRVPTQGVDTGLVDQPLVACCESLNYVAVSRDVDDQDWEEQETRSDVSLPDTSSDTTQARTKSGISRVPTQGVDTGLVDQPLVACCESLNCVAVSRDADDDQDWEEEQETSDVSLPDTSSDISRVPTQGVDTGLVDQPLVACCESLNYVAVSRDVDDDDQDWEVEQETSDVSLPDTSSDISRVPTQGVDTGLVDQPLVACCESLNYVAVGRDADDDQDWEEQETRSDVSLPDTSSGTTQPPSKSDISWVPTQGVDTGLVDQPLLACCESLNYVAVSRDADDDQDWEEEQETRSDVSLPDTSSDTTQTPSKSDISRVPTQGVDTGLVDKTLLV